MTLGAVARQTRQTRLSRLLGPVLGLCALLLYSRTMAPSLGGTIDSPEFQQATYSLSIVHPTGYPLYLLLGRLWITLFPFGDPAFRVNLLSAIFGALSVWMLYETVRYLTGDLVAGAGAAGLFAVQAIPWAQAGVAEINTLNTLLTGLAFLCAALWATGKLPLPVAALSLGFALSHHRTSALYVPLLFLFALAALRWGSPRRTTLRTGLLSVLLLLLPFAAYAYLPLRGFTTDWYTNDYGGFWAEVLGESALPVIQGSLARPAQLTLGARRLLGAMFTGWTGWALVLLGLLGIAYALAYLVRYRKAVGGRGSGVGGASIDRFKMGTVLLYAAAFLTGLAFSTLYDILDITDYLGVPVFMWCVVAGAGIALLGRLWHESVVRLGLRGGLLVAGRVALIAALGGLVVLTANRSLHRPDLRVDFSGLDRWAFWNSVKAEDERMRQGGILIGDWPEANEALYLQYVDNWRRDLRVTKVDDVLTGDGKQIDRWLAEKQPVYLVGEHQSILSRYDAYRKGEVWLLSGARPPEAIPPMQHTLNRRYGDSITLLGYTLQPDPAELSPGALLNVTLYWKTDVRLGERYTVFNHVVDASGAKIGQKDDEPGHGFSPTVYWEPGKVYSDTFPVALDPEAKPGTYNLVVGLYRHINDTRLPAFDASGSPLGDYPELAAVTIK